MLHSWEGYKGRFFIGLRIHLCLIQPWQFQTRTLWRTICYWGQEKGWGGDAFSVSMERVWSIHPDCSACLRVRLKELLPFFSLHFCDSPWHQTLQSEDLMEYPLVKWLLHASRALLTAPYITASLAQQWHGNYTKLGAVQLKSIKTLRLTLKIKAQSSGTRAALSPPASPRGDVPGSLS